MSESEFAAASAMMLADAVQDRASKRRKEKKFHEDDLSTSDEEVSAGVENKLKHCAEIALKKVAQAVSINEQSSAYIREQTRRKEPNSIDDTCAEKQVIQQQSKDSPFSAKSSNRQQHQDSLLPASESLKGEHPSKVSLSSTAEQLKGEPSKDSLLSEDEESRRNPSEHFALSAATPVEEEPTERSVHSAAEQLDLPNKQSVVSTAEQFKAGGPSATADTVPQVRQPMLPSDEPDLPEPTVSFSQGEAVDIRFKQFWVEAHVLGECRTVSGGYDVRYKDGDHIERGVGVTRIRRRPKARRTKPDYSLWPRWCPGDEVEVRMDGVWRRRKVVRGLSNGGADVDDADAVARSRIRAAPETFARAVTAVAKRARSCGASTVEEACTVDEGRATAHVVVKEIMATNANSDTLKISMSAGLVLVDESTGPELREGDELVSIDGVAIENLITVDDSLAEVAKLIDRSSCVRAVRYEAQVITARERHALELAWKAPPPTNGDAELAVIVDYIVSSMRAVRASDGVPEPDRAFKNAVAKCGGTSSSIDIAGLRRFLASLEPPNATGTRRRRISSAQLAAVCRLFDPSGDNVVSKGEFERFVYGAPRPVENLRDSVRRIAGCASGLETLFNSLDADLNGVIGKGELVDTLATYGLLLLPVEAEVLVKALDADKDGVTDLDELRNFVALQDDPARDVNAPGLPERQQQCASPRQDEETRTWAEVPVEKEAQPRRNILAEYISRCEELETQVRRLKRALSEARKDTRQKEKLPVPLGSLHRRAREFLSFSMAEDAVLCDVRAWPVLQQWLGGVAGLVAARAVMVARTAWRVCMHRTATSRASVADARRRAQSVIHAAQLERMRAHLERERVARVIAEQKRRVIFETNKGVASNKACQTDPSFTPMKAKDEVLNLLLPQQLNEQILENRKLQRRLRCALVRERSAIRAWHQANRNGRCFESAVRDAEVNFQSQLREARRAAERALQRAQVCEVQIQDARAKLHRYMPPAPPPSYRDVTKTTPSQSGAPRTQVEHCRVVTSFAPVP